MEILLFNQYFTSPKGLPQTILATLPINLLYLASYIKDKGMNRKVHELGVFDAADIIEENCKIRCGVPDRKIASIIKSENPKIIGLGLRILKELLIRIMVI